MPRAVIVINMKIKLFTDGGSRGNPGPAAIGIAIYAEDGAVIKKIKKTIGGATNNQAEYQAIVCGLEAARELKATEVACFLDSELVVKQINGQYKVKDQGLAVQFMKVWRLKSQFKKISFKHIPREKNKLADALVNEALDGV
jgi:ribonuclease HI